jgi:hypothetical protein
MAALGFWARAAGCWAGEATYFEGDMTPIIADYGNVLQIVVASGELLLREWKQYPASQLARGAGGPGLPPEEGFEVATESLGRIDAAGVADFGAEGRFLPLDGHSALRNLVDPESGAPRYRTWHTLPSADVLVTTQLGIHFTPFEADYYNRPLTDPVSGETRPNSRFGQLKGISVFRYRRIEASALETARADRRARFRIRNPAAGVRRRG